MDLYLRKVAHPQAKNSYRVVLKQDGTEVEIGSIGTTFRTEVTPIWTWGIDTVIPMRELESDGEGRDRKDCMKQFKAAWLRLCEDEGRLEEFLAMKRREVPVTWSRAFDAQPPLSFVCSPKLQSADLRLSADSDADSTQPRIALSWPEGEMG